MDIMCFDEIWVVDFEFGSQPGEVPLVCCLAAKEVKTGRIIQLFQDELETLQHPPFDIGKNSLFVGYYTSAEFSCFLQLGWPMPYHVLDLYAEFRNETSGLEVDCGYGLLGAMTYYNLPCMDAVVKDRMRKLVLRGNWTSDEKEKILDYCLDDVLTEEKLFLTMLPKIELKYSLIRGRFTWSIALIERLGIPLDVEMADKLLANRLIIQQKLIQVVDKQFGIYDGVTFKQEKFDRWINSKGIFWPRLKTGSLVLKDDTFKEMSELYPEIEPLRNLRVTLGQLRDNNLAIGKDGRCRCMLSQFGAKTGRNQPRGYIFGLSSWFRSLIKPLENKALIYFDYEQQEFGIAAKLSNDQVMMDAYLSGDPYLEFGKQAGAIPKNGTKNSHKQIRDRFKQTALAVQYGMGFRSLAYKLDTSPIHAQNLLDLHKKTYSKYWQWSDAIETYVQLKGKLEATFGWKIHLDQNANFRSFRNFPLQGNGSEMLRIACIFAHEKNIQIIGLVHDALLAECNIDEIEVVTKETIRAMEKASQIVLDGFTLRVEKEVFSYPKRFEDKRGVKMWEIVQGELNKLK